VKRTPLKRVAALRTSKPSLRRSRSTAKPTPAELEMFAGMRRLGCVACRLNREIGMPTVAFSQSNLEIHHVLSGGRRIGHHATICLCHYHHQGKRLPFANLGYTEQAKVYGPSLEREPKRFRAIYGSEESLIDFQQKLLAIAADAQQRLLGRVQQLKERTPACS
jgi:hypothetical protein